MGHHDRSGGRLYADRESPGCCGEQHDVGAAVGSRHQQPGSADFRDEVVIGSGLTFPTAFEFLPDGRMLIAEFRGRVLVAQPGASVVDPTPVLDLPNIFLEDVTAGGERGLVNVVADPNFATNGFIYSSIPPPYRSVTASRASRWWERGQSGVRACRVAGGSGLDQHRSPWRRPGIRARRQALHFHWRQWQSADLAAAHADHGKILRVNKDGTVPTDNPFFDGNGPNIDAIWARGLRNPYRFSFDPANGRMYIGDVGQNSVEEINIGVRGANYGWPTCEGSCATAGMTNPLFAIRTAAATPR